MKTALRLLLAILLIFLIFDVHASERTFECQSKVRLISGEVAPSDTPEGYRPLILSTNNWLTGISVFDGPPEDGAALKPSKTSQGGGRATWVFEGQFEKGKWFTCDYAYGLIRLAHELPTTSSVCTAMVSKLKSTSRIEGRVSCQ